MIDKEKLQLKIDDLQKLLDSQSTAYDFEKTFDEKWQQITQEVFFRRPIPLPGSPVPPRRDPFGKGMPYGMDPRGRPVWVPFR